MLKIEYHNISSKNLVQKKFKLEPWAIFRGECSTFQLCVHSIPVNSIICTRDDLCQKLKSIFHNLLRVLNNERCRIFRHAYY